MLHSVAWRMCRARMPAGRHLFDHLRMCAELLRLRLGRVGLHRRLQRRGVVVRITWLSREELR